MNVARAARGLTIPRRDAQTTLEGLNRLDHDVLAKKPDLVTIRFGFNDMTRISEEPFRRNLEAEEIRSDCRSRPRGEGQGRAPAERRVPLVIRRSGARQNGLRMPISLGIPPAKLDSARGCSLGTILPAKALEQPALKIVRDRRLRERLAATTQVLGRTFCSAPGDDQFAAPAGLLRREF